MAQNFLSCDSADGREHGGTPMKKILASLLAKHNVTEIVETLADICLEKGGIHSPEMNPGRRAMWKCNAMELSMTSGSLYNPRSND